MELTLNIASELESLLQAEADKKGSSPMSVAQELLAKSLTQTHPSDAPRLPGEESRLLAEINQGLSSEGMQRYRDLIQKRQDESISEEELIELRGVTQQMEALAVNRMKSLAELARLRGVDVEALMHELQIAPPDVL